MSFQQCTFRECGADKPAEMKGISTGVAVIGLGDLLGLCQGPFDLAVEPVLEAAVDKTRGNEKENQGGDQGETHEGNHQLSPEPRSEGVSSSLQDKPGDIAEYQVNQKYDQQQDDIDQGEDENAVGIRYKGIDLRETEFGPGKKDDQEKRDGNYYRFPLGFTCLRRAEPVFLGTFHQVIPVVTVFTTLAEDYEHYKQGNREFRPVIPDKKRAAGRLLFLNDMRSRD
jgi:hypothetical protein